MVLFVVEKLSWAMIVGRISTSNYEVRVTKHEDSLGNMNLWLPLQASW